MSDSEVARTDGRTGVRPELLELIACPVCCGGLTPSGAEGAQGAVDELICRSCTRVFAVREGVPILLDAPSKRERQTAELYSNLWEKFASRRHRPSGGYRAPATSHLELLRMAAGWDLIEGTVGIDAGCGPGDSVLEVADRHPDITVVGVDLADGVLSRATAAARRPKRRPDARQARR